MENPTPAADYFPTRLPAVLVEATMETNTLETSRDIRNAQLDRRLNDVGWGLLLMLTGAIWLMPAAEVPPGTWLFGVAAILLGVNVVRYRAQIGVSAFSVTIGLAALLGAISQIWRTDPPIVAIFLLVIGASLVARPLFARTA
jgi:hypothetical protein